MGTHVLDTKTSNTQFTYEANLQFTAVELQNLQIVPALEV